MNISLLILFPVIWISILCIIVFITKTWRHLNIRLMLLYVFFVAMIGPLGEILIGTLYKAAFGFPLWQYHVLPTHNAYTSYYAPVIWGVAGAYVYFSQEILKLLSKKTYIFRAGAQMIETITIEALLNISFLVFTGGYLFYYTPGDLLHFTSLQTLPFYFMLGLVVIKSIDHFKNDIKFYTAMCISIMTVVVFLTH